MPIYLAVNLPMRSNIKWSVSDSWDSIMARIELIESIELPYKIARIIKRGSGSMEGGYMLQITNEPVCIDFFFTPFEVYSIVPFSTGGHVLYNNPVIVVKIGAKVSKKRAVVSVLNKVEKYINERKHEADYKKFLAYFEAIKNNSL